MTSCLLYSLAMHSVLDTLSDSTGSTTANDLDLIFLKGIMESPVVSVTTHTHTHTVYCQKSKVVTLQKSKCFCFYRWIDYEGGVGFNILMSSF